MIRGEAADCQMLILPIEPQTSVSNRVWVIDELVTFFVTTLDADVSQPIFG